jgi:biotin carboxyl carrier protein
LFPSRFDASKSLANRREGAAIPITTLLLDGHAARLEWTQEAETYRYRFESQTEKAADIRQVEPGVYSVLVDGRSYEVRVDGANISVSQRTFRVELVDPRRWNRDRNHRQTEGVQNIAATMPGKVVRVLVSPGDQVEAGQGLIVVEAMKMQNEMKAVRAGRVVTLAAVAGATVNAGEILATIE